MALYIAICDDNIADRKQLERLFNREKDLRLKINDEVLYIDAFGSPEALMHTPFKYDIFLLDITTESQNGLEIAKTIRQAGIKAPIELMISSIDYSSYSNIPYDTSCITKPINQGQVAHVVDVAKAWAVKKPPVIELRAQKETLFADEKDLIRVISKNGYCQVALSDGGYIDIPGNMSSFIRSLPNLNSFISCKGVLISMYHIVSCDKNTFLLSNGERFAFSFHEKDKVIKSLSAFLGRHFHGELK